MKLKIIYTLMMVWILVVFPAGALTITGYVTDSSTNQPIAGHPVYIESVSNPQGGFVYNNVILTGLNGQYGDSINIPPQINVVFRVFTFDCYMQVHQQVVTSNQGSAQIDFTICNSSQPPCQAYFEYNAHHMNPLRIFFHDLSAGVAQEWLWSFGDGDTSSMKNPQHIYSQPGVYEVCLTISNNDSANLCSSTFCDSVYVDMPSPICQADFNWYEDILDPTLLSFVDLSVGNPTDWFWDFGDGNISVAANPTHQYNAPGTYNVCLYIFSNSPVNPKTCFDQVCKLVIVDSMSAPCNANFSYWSTLQNPLDIIFQDVSQGNITQWDWDFGDGSTGSGPIAQHLYADTGQYQVCLEISGPSCNDTLCQTVNINSPGNCNLAGQVFAGPFPAQEAQVQLFRKVNGFFMLDQVTTVDSFGVYYFYQALVGEYILRARPTNNAPAPMSFLPTYFLSAHHWSTADVIPLTQNVFGADILLRHAPPGMSGNGTVRGHVEYSNKQSDSLSGPAADIDIFLDNANGQPIAMTVTDAQGNFEFNSVNYGVLRVHAEVPGIPTIPAEIIINANNPVANNILLEIQPMMVLPVNEVDHFESIISQVYPNPVEGEQAAININYDQSLEIMLKIYDGTGRLVKQNPVSHLGGKSLIEIPTDDLSKGLYYVNLLIDEKILVSRKFIKK